MTLKELVYGLSEFIETIIRYVLRSKKEVAKFINDGKYSGNENKNIINEIMTEIDEFSAILNNSNNYLHGLKQLEYENISFLQKEHSDLKLIRSQRELLEKELLKQQRQAIGLSLTELKSSTYLEGLEQRINNFEKAIEEKTFCLKKIKTKISDQEDILNELTFKLIS